MGFRSEPDDGPTMRVEIGFQPHRKFAERRVQSSRIYAPNMVPQLLKPRESAFRIVSVSRIFEMRGVNELRIVGLDERLRLRNRVSHGLHGRGDPKSQSCQSRIIKKIALTFVIQKHRLVPKECNGN